MFVEILLVFVHVEIMLPIQQMSHVMLLMIMSTNKKEHGIANVRQNLVHVVLMWLTKWMNPVLQNRAV
jgi:hypothetical protein